PVRLAGGSGTGGHDPCLTRVVAHAPARGDIATLVSLKTLFGLGKEAAMVSGAQGRTYGFRNFYSDREQRLDDVGQHPPRQDAVSTQPRQRRESRSLRLQLPLVDGQTPGFWRPDGVLGS